MDPHLPAISYVLSFAARWARRRHVWVPNYPDTGFGFDRLRACGTELLPGVLSDLLGAGSLFWNWRCRNIHAR